MKSAANETNVRSTDFRKVSKTEGGVTYAPFTAHASLSRVKSDDPWGIKKPKSPRVKPSSLAKHHVRIVEEATPPTSARKSSTSHAQSIKPQSVAKVQLPKQKLQPKKSVINAEQFLKENAANRPNDPEEFRDDVICCHSTRADWLFLIHPRGIMMVIFITYLV